MDGCLWRLATMTHVSLCEGRRWKENANGRVVRINQCGEDEWEKGGRD